MDKDAKFVVSVCFAESFLGLCTSLKSLLLKLVGYSRLS